MKPLKLILLIAFVASFLGCKKYDEGPAISLRTAKARLVNDWVPEPKGSIDCSLFYTTGVEFFEDNTFVYKFNSQDTETGTWEFEENETVIVLTFNSGFTRQWKIIKLTKKKFWMTRTCLNSFLGVEYEMERQFTPVK